MNQFLYSEDDKVVVCLANSKGQQFKGIAKCNSSDSYSKEIGEKLATCRADMQIRKRDLNQIRIAKETVKAIIDTAPKHQSKLWMQWYHDACRVEKKQLKHMRNLKDQINNLSNGIIK